MRIQKLSGVKEPLTEDELRRAEGEIGAGLPGDYRRFLLAHNGGRPEECVFRFKCEGKDWTPAAVAYFLAVYDGRHENLLEYHEAYRDRVPAGLLPVARDPGGNLILLGVSRGHEGRVYFWLQDSEPEEPDFSNVCFVANSFDEFINSLRELDPL